MKMVNRVREAWEASTKRAARRLDRRQPPERAVVLVTATVVGIGAGFGAVGFRVLIESITSFSFDGLPRILGGWAAIP